jgi:signal transduction histidine kinase
MLLNLDLVAEQVPEPAEARLGLVREEAGRLGRLIENVLTFSRGEQGKLTVRATACQPSAIVDSIATQFAASFERKNITLRRTGDAATPCVLDSDALAQIVANLLSNVEKYAPGSEVALTSSWENGALTVRVADTGPGIPAHAAERVFLPFERVDSLITEGSTGTGLGLAIARELAHEMGGTLTLLPAERGATFELKVPAPPVPEPKTAAA